MSANHDLSHHRITSFPMGRITPTFARVLAPGEEVDITSLDVFRLEPFQYSIMDTMTAKSDWYFVPMHQIYEGWERYLTGLVTDQPNLGMETNMKVVIDALPWFPYMWWVRDDVSGASVDQPETLAEMELFKRGWDPGVGLFNHLCIPPPFMINLSTTGTLDYGEPRPPQQPTGDNYHPASDSPRISAMAFLAYHKIIDDKFRDEEMERPSLDWPLDWRKHCSALALSAANGGVAVTDIMSPDYVGFNTTFNATPVRWNLMLRPSYWNRIRFGRNELFGKDNLSDASSFPDVMNVLDNGFQTRRCRWDWDYLTSRRPNPQRGGESSVSVDLNGAITVDSIRFATAEQNQNLRLQRSGGQLADYYEKMFGVTCYDCMSNVVDHVHSDIEGLQVSDVLQTSETGDSPQGNPVGYSRTVSRGKHFKYKALSFGILMRLTRVYPPTTYQYSVDPMHLLLDRYDFFTPKFEGIGWQPVQQLAALCMPVTTGQAPERSWNLAESAYVTGWHPPYQYWRQALSHTTGAFNSSYRNFPGVSSGPYYQFNFQRDYFYPGDQYSEVPLQWRGEITGSFLKCDPTNYPFATQADQPAQIQLYSSYHVDSKSPVPHAINNTCLTH